MPESAHADPVGVSWAKALLAAAAAIVWLLSAGEAAADQHLTGDVFDFGITVPGAPITAGDTMVFTNNGAQPHTVTDRGNTFDTEGILPGDTAEVTFDVPGVYEIFCRINPGAMNATVVVEPDPDEPPNEVRVQTLDPNREGEELRFDPDEVQVRPGSKITVANVGGAPHTLTAEDGTFDTGRIEPGAEEGRFAGDHASFTVDETGVFDFFCEIHPDAMTGTLIVAGDPVDAATEPEPEPEPEELPDPGGGASDAAAVDIQDFSFDPVETAVLPGGTVRFTNSGAAPHTATFDEVEGRVEGLDTGTIDSGGAVDLAAPDAPGSYSYFCAIHPDMRGVLVVAAGGDPPEADDADEPDAVDEPDDTAEAETAEAEPDDSADAEAAAVPPTDEGGGFSIAALVGAFAIGIAGGGAIVIALRGRDRTRETEGSTTG